VTRDHGGLEGIEGEISLFPTQSLQSSRDPLVTKSTLNGYYFPKLFVPGKSTHVLLCASVMYEKKSFQILEQMNGRN
jgi:hypothetical protein